MKRNFYLITALSIIFLFACKGESGKSTNGNIDRIEREIISNNELVATPEMSIIENSDANMEWDMITGSKIKIENHRLDQILKLMIGNSPARVIIEGDHHNPLMKISYEPIDVWESSKEGNKQILVDSLQKYFDFEISTETRNMEVVTISAFDDSLLIPRDGLRIGTTLKRSGNIVAFKNYSLQAFFEALEQNLYVIFDLKIEDYHKYDIKLNMVNFDKAMQDLIENYGFEINTTTEDTEIYLVKF